MQYEDLVRDFAKRTRENMQILSRATTSGEPDYNTTQLVNSLLGLLVLPKERYIDQIPPIPLDELRERGWPEPVLLGTPKPPSNLKQLIRLLRNSIAHFNIEFVEKQGEITGVKLWNTFDAKACDCAKCSECDRKKCKCAKKPTRTWQVRMTIGELNELLDRFCEVILPAR